MKQHGFTLLEIMLVILLIGSISSLVLVSFPASSQHYLQQERDHLRDQLDFALNISQQDGMILGLQIHPQGWVFKTMKYHGPEAVFSAIRKDDHVWKTWQPRYVVMEGNLSDEFSLEVLLQGKSFQQLSNDKSAPQILLLPDGETTPFIVLFKQNGSKDVAGLRIDQNWNIEVFQDEDVQ